MRITGGAARGIQLEVPQQFVRPATDYLREQVFNRLSQSIIGKIILDCCAGTGAYGLEALSRGAQKCYFLEKNQTVINSLKKNCEYVLKSAQRDRSTIEILTADIFLFPSEKIPQIDYLFFDPPYIYWEKKLPQLLSALESIAYLHPQTIFVIEYPTQFQWPSNHLLQAMHPIKLSKKKNAPTINFFKTMHTSYKTKIEKII